jgi:hypothetical protein
MPTLPRRCDISWGIVASVGVGIVGGIISGNDQETAAQQQAQNNKETTNLTTQRQIWLAQQQRAWDLQDKATDRAQKAADIGTFNTFQSDPSKYKAPPNLYANLSQQTQNPAWDPTQDNAFSQFAGGQNAAPAQPAPVEDPTRGRGTDIIWQPS